jgi:putative ABC transport system ATP-binding protein
MIRKKKDTPAAAKPVISLTNMSKIYGMEDATTVALDNISLTVEEGEFVVIMGPSGCGKTTLMNILGLLDSPTHGSYKLEGGPVAELSQRKRARYRRNKIGFIFQSFNLLPRVSVIENVALPLMYRGWGQTRRLKAASRLLKTFGLSEREYYVPHQLSGGQMQRVAIARALVNNPAIILADEPTGNLDSKSSEIIMQELSDVHKKGHTIIMVTHNPNLIVYADRVIQMIDGRIARDSKHRTKTKRTTKRPLGATAKTTTKKKGAAS